MLHRLSRCINLSIVLFGAAIASAQQPVQPPATAAEKTAQAAILAGEYTGTTPIYIKPETAAERHERVGLVDPGPDPNRETIFYRFGKAFYIERFDRKWAKFDQDPGLVRPFAFTPFVYELYQYNDKYVWVWVQQTPVDAAQVHQDTADKTMSPGSIGHYTAPQVAWLRYIRPEFTDLNVPDSGKTIVFEESSEGLPTSGSWRNSLSVADMNGDGFADLVVPPQRGGSNGLPTIFLGDGKGHWKTWKTFWPYRIDYGAAATGDFNKDGKMDVAFSVHLQGVRLFLGDGKGNFVDSSKGMSTADFPTRRLLVKDIDGDGYPDVVAISEGPVGREEVESTNRGKIRAFLNKKHGSEWTSIDIADPKYTVGGDYLASGNFNGDRTPDFFGSSVYFQAHNLLYMSDKTKKLSWAPAANLDEGKIVPFLSYYTAMAAGPFSSKKLDDVIVSYLRFWQSDIDPQIASKPETDKMLGLDRITFTDGEPKRVPVIRFAGTRPISGLGSGDFDGDGKLDVVFTRFEPQREAVLLLGDGKGNFARAATKGLKLEPQTNYDLTVADVNGDGRPDVIIMYESQGESKIGLLDGSIHVFLNRGAESDAAKNAAKK